jgi:hypothetical protein
VTPSSNQWAWAVELQDCAAPSCGWWKSVEVRTGQATEELVDETDNAGLIVVGSRGLGGYCGMLLGSVANALTAHGRCPVMMRGRKAGAPPRRTARSSSARPARRRAPMHLSSPSMRRRTRRRRRPRVDLRELVGGRSPSVGLNGFPGQNTLWPPLGAAGLLGRVQALGLARVLPGRC